MDKQKRALTSGGGKHTSVYIPVKLLEATRVRADELRISWSRYVTEALVESYLKDVKMKEGQS